MGNNLNWIFEITDKISDPIKEIMQNLGGLQNDLNKNKKGFDKVGSSINDLKAKLSGLKGSRDKAFRTDHIKKYNGLIQETEKRLRKLEDLPPKKMQANWQDMALGMNQTFEMVDRLSQGLSFTSEIHKLETDIKRFTNLTGDDLDDALSKSYKIGEVFNENSGEIVRAANAMTDQIGGSFADNLDLIKKGFEKGANLNNDMLDQLKEYGPQLKASGISGAEGLAIMAQAAKDGVYSDKALDAIKEGGNSLREMGKAQVDALAGIGVKQTDLVGKSTINQIKLISKAMQGANDHAKQMVLADIFKGAGEDAGAGFFDGLATNDMDLDKIPSFKQPFQWIKEMTAGAKVSIANIGGGFLDALPMVAQFGTGIMTAMGVVDALKESQMAMNIIQKASAMWTGIVTGVTWAWGAALNFGLWPITLIVGGIALLIAGLIWAYDEFEGFRNVIDSVVGVLMDGVKWLGEFFGLMGDEKTVDATVNVTKKEKTEIVPNGDAEIIPPTEYGNAPIVGGAPKGKGKPTKQADKKGGFASAEKKEINVSIQNLVKNLNINVPSVSMSKGKIQQLINEALVGAVRDFEVAI